MMEKLNEIVFDILEKVADTKQKWKKGIFTKQGGYKEQKMIVSPIVSMSASSKVSEKEKMECNSNFGGRTSVET
ncbi:SH3 domain-containing protein [Zea mays]|uniref:SH3 domain-containing protein n=1 Tax=Zea mays TaxID=4577 RepID=A0A1D6NY91_MAIZE|nr:SH3 domain-containing protein [Zea mays]